MPSPQRSSPNTYLITYSFLQPVDRYCQLVQLASEFRLEGFGVDSIEKQTGYDLLSNIPESVQRVIEATVDVTNV